MKGALHQQLRRALDDACQRKACTQESLGAAMGKSQRSVGQYLSDEAGALDLDEADAALHHVGSTLQGFLSGAPLRALTESERLACALVERPALLEFVADLLLVPKTQLPAILELIRGLGRFASGRRGGRTSGLGFGPNSVPRSKSAPVRRPKAPIRKQPRK